MTLSLDDLPLQAASRSESQGFDPAYLVSVALVAAAIIGVFFGVGFSLLVPEQITGSAGSRDSGTEVKSWDSIVSPHLSSEAHSVPIESELPLAAAPAPHPVASLAQDPAAHKPVTSETMNPPPGSVSPAGEAALSAATGAVPSATVPVLRSTARQATLTPPAPVSPVERASGLPVATTPASPPLAPEVEDLLARGDSFVVIGDIASARVFYQRAADAGDGRATLRMGATFDPTFLSRAGLPRTFGDRTQARSWYRRASELDAVKTERR
jgi:hypothetical protein